MNGLAVLVDRGRVEAVLDGAADRGQITVAGGGEHRVALAQIDGGLELPPAREAVLAGDEQLGVGQPGRSVLPSHLTETLLGFVAEVLEVGAGGKLT